MARRLAGTVPLQRRHHHPRRQGRTVGSDEAAWPFRFKVRTRRSGFDARSCGRRLTRGLTRSVRTQRRSTAAAPRPTPERRNPRRLGLGLRSEESGWRDLNPRPFDPQSNALPNCATARVIQKCNPNRATTPYWQPQITHAKSTQNGTNKPTCPPYRCLSVIAAPSNAMYAVTPLIVAN